MGRQVVLGVGRLLGAFALLLFVPAGSIFWPQAWVFLGISLVLVVFVSVLLYRKDPALLAERMRPGLYRAESWDRKLSRWFSLSFLAWLGLMSLDAARFHWSHVPLWLNVGGAIGVVLAAVLMYRVFLHNTFLTAVVRIQRERGRRVISSGPYGHVRHPLYAAELLLLPSTALLLGSWVGLAAAVLLGLLLVLRTALEDRTLRAGLEGYVEYADRVGYRLVPRIW